MHQSNRGTHHYWLICLLENFYLGVICRWSWIILALWGLWSDHLSFQAACIRHCRFDGMLHVAVNKTWPNLQMAPAWLEMHCFASASANVLHTSVVACQLHRTSDGTVFPNAVIRLHECMIMGDLSMYLWGPLLVTGWTSPEPRQEPQLLSLQAKTMAM